MYGQKDAVAVGSDELLVLETVVWTKVSKCLTEKQYIDVLGQ